MPGNTAKSRGQDKAREVWTDPGVFATTLITLFIDRFGTEGLSWSAETISMEIYDDFGVPVPSTNFDRLMAAINVVTSNGFYTSTPDFCELCCVLSGDPASPDVLQLPTAADIAWGLTEGVLLSPPEDDNPFSQEIIHFISEVVSEEGIIVPPDILRVGQVGRDLKEVVRMGFSDDPDMFSAIWKTEDLKTGDINDLIKYRLNSLFNQLLDLPLINGSTVNIVSKMRQNLASYKRS